MPVLDPRLEGIKAYPRAMRFYVLTLHEIILESNPSKVLEIGTQNGQSTKAILTALAKNGRGKLISLDHKNRSGILDVEYEDLKPYWHFIQGNTHLPETFEAAKDALEGELFDVIFIDGDHKYEGAKQDFVEYTKLLKPGGVAILHDTINKNEGVNRVWAEIDWPEKFNYDWGVARGRDNLIVGFGLTRKPYDKVLEQEIE